MYLKIVFRHLFGGKPRTRRLQYFNFIRLCAVVCIGSMQVLHYNSTSVTTM
jgi:hypothetical protein